MTKSFFRPQALEAANRIDALPQSMRVTSSLSRAAAGLLALGVVAGVAVSGWVEVPIAVKGDGVLVDQVESLTAPVAPSSQGRVATINVRIGQRVETNQLVATLAFPERQATIRETRAQLATARQSAAHKAKLRAAEAAASDRANVLKQTELDHRISQLEQKTKWLQQLLDDVNKLSEKGLMTRPKVIDARLRQAEASDELRQAHAERVALDAQREQQQGGRELAALTDQLEIERLEQQLEALLEGVKAESELRAISDGVVSSVNARRGALVSPGEPIIELLQINEGAGDTLQAVVFVPLDAGKRVQPGDRALLKPSSLPEGNHDRLIAKVLRVSETPVSSIGLKNILGSDELAAKAGSGGPVFAVYLELQRGADGAGYNWTSAEAPAEKLTAGTPLSARLTVERTSLLALAVPALKDLIGADRDAWAGGR